MTTGRAECSVDTRTLLATGQAIAALGVGCWQLGGKGWGRDSGANLTAAVDRALDLGLRLFDTAPVYGFGESERTLGKLLRRRSEETVVVSKGGLVWDARRRVRHDNSPPSLRRQLEASLNRLGRETIDVYLLHWPDPRVSLAESAAALESWRREGLLRSWGISNFPAQDIRQWLDQDPDTHHPLVVELPLNLLGRDTRGQPLDDSSALLALANEKGWDVVAYDVLGRGLLAGNYDMTTRFGKRDVRHHDARYAPATMDAHLRRVGRLQELAAELQTTSAALSIRAVLDRPGVTAALTGVRSAEQVEDNVEALELTLPEAVRRELLELAV